MADELLGVVYRCVLIHANWVRKEVVHLAPKTCSKYQNTGTNRHGHTHTPTPTQMKISLTHSLTHSPTHRHIY